MNKDVFLNCLNYTGINTGTLVLGLYSFSSGLNDACFNQIYSSGYNYYSGLPYDSALPLIYNGSGNQTSGNFHFNQSYHIPNKNLGNFSALISMNYSGCLNTGNSNLVLFSTISNFSGINSGVILGITPSNRLFLNASEYFSTISEEITPNDLAFISVEENRFVNFGIFNIKNHEFYKKSYDYGNSNLIVEKLYFGGVLKYPKLYTGYSGKLNEIYLFSGNIDDFLFNSCIDCTYATGYSYSQTIDIFGQVKITGSYWSGINEVRITGNKKTTGNFLKTDGTTGNFYYDSGISGNIEVYQNLFPKTGIDNFYITGSGINFYFDSQKKISQTKFNLFFDLGLKSGDIVEIYTYKDFNSNVNLNVINNTFPITNNYVQLFGNGLAETKQGESLYFSDYFTGFNNKIFNFDDNDILLYDLNIENSITVPYNTTGCKLGSNSSSEVIDLFQVGNSGIQTGDAPEKVTPFNYDIYLNGKKLISGLDYKINLDIEYGPNETLGIGPFDVYSNHILLSGDSSLFFNLEDPQEFKLVFSQNNYIRNLFTITQDTYFITGLSGFSEQIWKNGIRQKNGIDFYVKNNCTFYSGEYLEPDYKFQIFNSNSSFINDYVSYNSSYLDDLIAYYNFETFQNEYFAGNNCIPFIYPTIKSAHIFRKDLFMYGNLFISPNGKNNNGIATNVGSFLTEPFNGGLRDTGCQPLGFNFEFNNKSYTVSFWFKYPSGLSFTEGKVESMFSWGYAVNEDDVGIDISLYSGFISGTTSGLVLKNKISSDNQNENNFYFYDSPSTFTFKKDSWYHLASIYDKDSNLLKLILNGVKDNSQNNVTLISSGFSNPINLRVYPLEDIGRGNRSIWVGRSSKWYDPGPFPINPTQSNVLIDELAIWYRALTEKEILNLYNSGNGRFYDNF